MLLRDRIDAHLADWQKDQGSPYYRVLKKWTGESPATFIPEGVTRALVLLATSLVVGVLVLRRTVIARTGELAESNRHLQATLDAIPDLLFEVDREGRYLMVRARQAGKLAAPAEALPGRMIQDVLPADAARVCLEAIAEASREGCSAGQSFALVLADGVRWFELSVARKAPLEGGQPTFMVLSRDVTDRHNAEVAVVRLSRLYATLSQCNQAIVRSESEPELLARICQDAVAYGGMRMVWVGMVDDADRSVRPVAWFGEGTEYLDGLRISIEPQDAFGRGPTGTAIREDRPCWCNDFRNDPATLPWRERAQRFGWAASAALPLHRDGRVAGSLTLYAAEVGAFDEAAQRLLLEMAMDIDFALDRFRKDEDRARMAEALVEREEKYRELTESINDVIWTLDPETLRFLYVSPSVFRLRGYTPDEIMADPLDAALTPESAARVRELINAHVSEFEAGTRSSDEVAVELVEQPRKDGSTVWTEVVTNLVRNRRTGKVEIRGVTRDISERKRAEAEIQRLAHFDHLTGLPNRTLLKDRFHVAMSLAQRTGQHLAVMFLDLDHFKNINDTLGHDVGDALLVEVARRLETTLRAGDTLCRLNPLNLALRHEIHVQLFRARFRCHNTHLTHCLI
ncbi:MAG: diguanylate cyclase [Zoogloeaceae bacterium]|nr:diguanylate cyclase [Zoogloeaceae bacterium]